MRKPKWPILGLAGVSALGWCLRAFPSAKEASFDFVIKFSSCAIAAASFGNAPKMLDSPGGSYTLGCVRSRKTVACQLAFSNGDAGVKGSQVDYRVTSEIAGRMVLEANSGADFVHVRLSRGEEFGRAVSLTRVHGDDYSGTKICSGVFVTSDELEGLTQLKVGAKREKR